MIVNENKCKKKAKKRIQRDFFHDMILDSNESAIFALVIKTVYIKMAKSWLYIQGK